ncbi:MAG: rod shape determining protein RodA [Candidatus Azotimanducaceae bacterium]|jgi:rod shape determining protein RodA|tara:strand:+ start:172 stop:1302 length:1131 start_codon:yes stop_codon:yes gene_type:complete
MSSDFQRQLPSYSVGGAASWYTRVHVDPILLLLITGVVLFGLVVLSSAVDGNDALFDAQVRRIGAAYAALIIAAQLPPAIYLRWAPVLYFLGLILLILVLLVGVKVKGSQRWIDIPGLFRFQPSELMKIAVPMAVAWYLQQRVLPPSLKHTLFSLLIIGVPAFLIGIEPDLGTSILVIGAGVSVLLLAGLSWRWIFGALTLVAAAAPLIWQFVLKDYQQQRILTLFDPQSDPLGAGWNIIQSTTAIGSGGVFGKGLYQGSQSYLDFLPEARTDFIVAVVGEELGFVGIAFLLTLYLLIIARGLFLASQAGSTFGRLVAGALVLTFFIYLFVNIAMVSGILPVVGVPLPLVSYGGTSAITLMAGFGIIMSMRTHKAW